MLCLEGDAEMSELVGQADDLADDRARGRVRDHAVGAFA
jgi:hypothetical protein